MTEAGAATIATSAVIADEHGRVCARASASFVPLGHAQMLRATGAEPEGRAAASVRP